MNLQICVPYEPCPFNCPMCIARGRKVFENLYETYPARYFEELKFHIAKGTYDYFILTGNTDPTLNKQWLNDVSKFLSGRHVELQTRNYNLQSYDLRHIETVAYSISTLKDYLKSWNFRKTERTNRLVIMLTREFEILNPSNFNPMGYNQITFKKLQMSADPITNTWIKENEMVDSRGILDIVNHYNGTDVSVRIDANCQDSHGRYEIFREDAQIYKTWEEK